MRGTAGGDATGATFGAAGNGAAGAGAAVVACFTGLRFRCRLGYLLGLRKREPQSKEKRVIRIVAIDTHICSSREAGVCGRKVSVVSEELGSPVEVVAETGDILVRKNRVVVIKHQTADRLHIVDIDLCETKPKSEIRREGGLTAEIIQNVAHRAANTDFAASIASSRKDINVRRSVGQFKLGTYIV